MPACPVVRLNIALPAGTGTVKDGLLNFSVVRQMRLSAVEIRPATNEEYLDREGLAVESELCIRLSIGSYAASNNTRSEYLSDSRKSNALRISEDSKRMEHDRRR
jgi:hypothetical protein